MGCNGGGGGGGDAGAADPVFAYRRDGGSAAKIYLANADGSEATLVFTGVKFSRTGEPSVHGDADGGTLLIETFRNLHWIDYAVTDGVVTVLENIKVLDRGPDDFGLSILAPQPQWSPDGEDFVYKNGAVNPAGSDMYIYSRATSDPMSQAITIFGPPIFSGPRENCPGVDCRETHDLGWLAWDKADTIYFTIRIDDGQLWELRSLDINVCNNLPTDTCLLSDTTCIASTSTCGEPLGLTSFSHVSVSYEPSSECRSMSAGTPPRILVGGQDANGDSDTFVLDGSGQQNFPGILGQDWTQSCTILGAVGDNVVELDPYASGGTTTLVSRKVSVPDWIN